MRIRLRTASLGLAVMGAMGLASSAQASLLPVSTVIEQTGTGSSYTYKVNAPSGVRVETGHSFTIYDFAGFTGVTEQPTNWVFSQSLVGPAYDGITTLDDPTLMNLTWTYNGSPIVATSEEFLGFFKAFSSFTGAGSVGDGLFTSVAVRNSDGVEVNNITKVTKAIANGGNNNPPVDPDPTDPTDPTDPPPSNETPEPASLALLGLGLPLAGAFRRRLLAAKA